MTTTHVMADMSTLTTLDPADRVTVLGFYIGGDTPSIPTHAEIEAIAPRYLLPIFTRSNPTSANVSVAADVTAALKQLHALGAPTWITVGLDLETAISIPYVTTFNAQMGVAGYQVLAYGSKSSLFHNPKPSAGYWVADYTGIAHLYPGTVATQYADPKLDHRPYDLSLISTEVKLWDRAPSVTTASNPAVVALQKLLNQYGATLAEDGQKGPLTKAAFTALVNRTGPVELGSTGIAVKAVQAMLNTWPITAPLIIDGQDGRLTNAAVITFQRAHAVKGGYNGQIGPYTKAALAV